ncbi:hypothetical protein ACQEVX_30455 [Streptomyces syringium]|uniref:hypothetical protein n=1 Tax=Streptomyces syringium TaxID=76729 RepID=UPI003D929D7A
MHATADHIRGYRISIDMPGHTVDRFPELTETTPDFPEPVVVVIELGDARHLNLTRLSRDLGRYQQSTAVVSHSSRIGRQVTVLDLGDFRAQVADWADTGGLLRLERSIRRTTR